jgi:hypothetical protein
VTLDAVVDLLSSGPLTDVELAARLGVSTWTLGTLIGSSRRTGDTRVVWDGPTLRLRVETEVEVVVTRPKRTRLRSTGLDKQTYMRMYRATHRPTTDEEREKVNAKARANHHRRLQDPVYAAQHRAKRSAEQRARNARARALETPEQADARRAYWRARWTRRRGQR